MSNEPDSEADDYLSISVRDTPERDNPKFGAVTIELSQTPQRSQSIRMSRVDAVDLHDALTHYLETSK